MCKGDVCNCNLFIPFKLLALMAHPTPSKFEPPGIGIGLNRIPRGPFSSPRISRPGQEALLPVLHAYVRHRLT